jgi:hypothetical protein
MKKIKNFLFFAVFFTALTAWSQLSITMSNQDYTIDFDNTLTDVNNGKYTAAGLQPTPTSGQLDGTTWKIILKGNNFHDFDATTTSADYTRGVSTGSVTDAGLYAFTVETNNNAFGFQNSADIFTPGDLILKTQNKLGGILVTYTISYDLWVYNDTDNSVTVNFDYSTDDTSYANVTSLNFDSPTTQDLTPTWTKTSKTATVTALNIADDSFVFLRWDISGGDDADEIAIDNIVVNFVVAQTSTTWEGDVSDDWLEAGNWSNGIPASETDTTLPDVSGSGGSSPTIGRSDVGYVKDLTITGNQTLTIAPPGAGLNISGNLDTTNGTLLIKSNDNKSGAVILKGTATSGDDGVIYDRRIKDTNWHLIAAPVAAQNITSFAGASSLALGSGTGDDQNQGLSHYDNSLASRWVYYTTNNPFAGNFPSGKGYAIKTTVTDEKRFTGDFVTANVSVSLTDNSGGIGNKWNLIGNPYPSFISLNDDATDATENFLTENSASLDPSFVGIYVWNPGTAAYELINHTEGSQDYLSPGQGFFVNSIDGGATVDFTENMQSLQSASDLFFRNSTISPEIEFRIADNTTTQSTKIKYLHNATTGLDLGYDGGLFDGLASGMSVYTHLVSQSSGVNFMLQCLPDSGYENMVIPIGFKALLDRDSEGNIIPEPKQIKFSALVSNFPSNLYVYLEDTLHNSFTRIDEANSEYAITITEDTENLGRFFIHTTHQTLEIDDVHPNIQNINIYTTDEKKLRIVGISQGQVSMSFISVLGKEIYSTTFNARGSNEISLSNFKTGIYFVQLQVKESVITKKILLY